MPAASARSASRTISPWGTLDQGGNVVEWTDTITPPPFGANGHRVWRRLHGGIANAPVYQLWLSAVGLQPQDNAFFTATYPWLGIRIGVIGSRSPQLSDPAAVRQDSSARAVKVPRPITPARRRRPSSTSA